MGISTFGCKGVFFAFEYAEGSAETVTADFVGSGKVLTKRCFQLQFARVVRVVAGPRSCVNGDVRAD